MAFNESIERWRPLVSKYFAPQDVDAALAVMQIESGGDPGRASEFNKRGTENSWGLFQVNIDAHGGTPQQWSNPETNVSKAAQLRYGAGNWRDWYNSANALGLPVSAESGGEQQMQTQQPQQPDPLDTWIDENLGDKSAGSLKQVYRPEYNQMWWYDTSTGQFLQPAAAPIATKVNDDAVTSKPADRQINGVWYTYERNRAGQWVPVSWAEKYGINTQAGAAPTTINTDAGDQFIVRMNPDGTTSQIPNPNYRPPAASSGQWDVRQGGDGKYYRINQVTGEVVPLDVPGTVQREPLPTMSTTARQIPRYGPDGSVTWGDNPNYVDPSVQDQAKRAWDEAQSRQAAQQAQMDRDAAMQRMREQLAQNTWSDMMQQQLQAAPMAAVPGQKFFAGFGPNSSYERLLMMGGNSIGTAGQGRTVPITIDPAAAWAQARGMTGVR